MNSAQDIKKNVELFRGITQHPRKVKKHIKNENHFKDFKPAIATRDYRLNNPDTQKEELDKLARLYYQVEYNKNIVSGNLQPAFNPSPYASQINYIQTPLLKHKRAKMAALADFRADNKQDKIDLQKLLGDEKLVDTKTIKPPAQFGSGGAGAPAGGDEPLIEEMEITPTAEEKPAKSMRGKGKGKKGKK